MRAHEVSAGLLDDPAYEPAHPPGASHYGSVPEVVALWGPRSQVRWFRRFMKVLRWRTDAFFDRFYVDSTLHTGLCCYRCLGLDDLGDPADYWEGDGCCCRQP